MCDVFVSVWIYWIENPKNRISVLFFNWLIRDSIVLTWLQSHSDNTQRKKDRKVYTCWVCLCLSFYPALKEAHERRKKKQSYDAKQEAD